MPENRSIKQGMIYEGDVYDPNKFTERMVFFLSDGRNVWTTVGGTFADIYEQLSALQTDDTDVAQLISDLQSSLTDGLSNLQDAIDAQSAALSDLIDRVSALENP